MFLWSNSNTDGMPLTGRRSNKSHTFIYWPVCSRAGHLDLTSHPSQRPLQRLLRSPAQRESVWNNRMRRYFRDCSNWQITKEKLWGALAISLCEHYTWFHTNSVVSLSQLVSLSQATITLTKCQSASNIAFWWVLRKFRKFSVLLSTMYAVREKVTFLQFSPSVYGQGVPTLSHNAPGQSGRMPHPAPLWAKLE